MAAAAPAWAVGELEVLAEDARHATSDGGRYFAWTLAAERGAVWSHDSRTRTTRRLAVPEGCSPVEVQRNAAAGRLALRCPEESTRLLRLGSGVAEMLPATVRFRGRTHRALWYALGERWIAGSWFEAGGRRYVPYLDFRSGRVVVRREDYAVLWNIDSVKLTRMCPLPNRPPGFDEWPGARDFSGRYRLAPAGLTVHRCGGRRIVLGRRGAGRFLARPWLSWVRGGRGHVGSLHTRRIRSFALPPAEASDGYGGGSGVIHTRHDVLVHQPTSVTCGQGGCIHDGFRLWRARIRG